MHEGYKVQTATNFKISKDLNLFYIVFKNKKYAIWADLKKNYHSNLEQILTWSVFDNNKMIWMAKFSQSYLVKWLIKYKLKLDLEVYNNKNAFLSECLSLNNL